MRIALFITCVNDLLFPGTGKAVLKILNRLGHEVEFPLDQTCCGQMHANSGHHGQAVPLAQNFAKTFSGYDAVVAPSGSCVAMVRDHYPRLGVTPPPTYELSELLIDVLGVTDVGASFPHRVTYHPTCHGLRMLRLDDKPLRLLRNVRGLELVELPGAEECCGFGGTFAIKNADVSTAMLQDKCDAITATQSEYIATADNSCLTHIGGGLSRQRSSVRPIHYAEILAEA